MAQFLAPKWLIGHIVVAAVAVAFLRLGWWQWEHARAGNSISYGYALQWPLFAAFGVVFWLRLLRDRLAQDENASDDGSEPDSEPLPAPPIGPSWSFRRGAGMKPRVEDERDPPSIN